MPHTVTSHLTHPHDHTHDHTHTPAPANSLCLAAPAPPADPADDASTLDQDQADRVAHELFESWATWRATRRYFVPTTGGGNILGKLRGPTRPSRPAPDAVCSAQMAALNRAINAQPRDAVETQVFLLYYVSRVRNIKTVADYLGISRQHFYRLRHTFGQRVIMAAKQLEAEERAAGEALPHLCPAPPAHPHAYTTT